MSFVDKVSVSVKAGDGGNGKLSFRHEKYINRGGPDGGDGGKGGDIILKASRNQDTLTAFRYQKELVAESGHNGDRRKMHGKSGHNLIVAVPIGTMVSDSQGLIVADLVEDNQEALVAQGGKGGFGNAHFISSRRQAPNFAEKGDLGEYLELEFELKMIADVGLVGLPNAGKSTLLSKVSNAHPEIANYPFTTLVPNLGVVDIDKTTTVLMADIPGLIEGAADGKGLGHDFLRHIERTSVILHLIDAYTADVANAYGTVRQELQAYSKDLVKRPEIVALTKMEGLDKDIINDQIASLKKVVPRKTKVLAISSLAGENLQTLLYEIKRQVAEHKAKLKAKASTKQPAIPVLTLQDTQDKWKVKKHQGVFIVSGPSIERFARRTDFANDEGVQRLRDIMRRQGIVHELLRRGIKADQVIQIGDDPEHSLTY